MDVATLSQQLEEQLQEIKKMLDEAKVDGLHLNEANTEHKIIDPLLHLLGYSLLQISKRGHDSVANNFPDYTLLPNTPHKWFLEVKRFGLPLQDKEAAQAVSYANNQGTKWAVLTNGREWCIYNSFLTDLPAERRVMQVKNLFADTDGIDTLLLLSRHSMQSGGLNDAWNHERVVASVKSQLETSNSPIREHLCEIARKEIGTAVDDAAIARAIAECGMIGIKATRTNDEVSPPQPPATPPATAATASVPHPLPASVKPHAGWYTLKELAADKTLTSSTKSMPKKRLKIIEFSNGNRKEQYYWWEVAVAVVTWISQQYKLPRLPFTVSSGGNTKNYFLNSEPVQSDGEKMEKPREVKVDGKTVYVDAKKDARHIAMNLAHLLEAVGASPSAVKIKL